MAQTDTLPVYEPDDSAALSNSTTRELLRDQRPESRVVDQLEQAVEAQKVRTGTRFTGFDIFRHGRRKPCIVETKTEMLTA